MSTDPATGKQLWFLPGLDGNRTITGPTVANGMVYATCGMRRDLVAVKIGGSGELPASAVVWRTKDNTALYCRFLGKKGQLNLSKVENIGLNPEIETGRQDGDVLQLVFLNQGQLAPERLKTVLQEHAAGFRQNFAK